MQGRAPLATALARIDAIGGWGADDLLAAFADLPDGAGHALAAFAQAGWTRRTRSAVESRSKRARTARLPSSSSLGPKGYRPASSRTGWSDRRRSSVRSERVPSRPSFLGATCFRETSALPPATSVLLTRRLPATGRVLRPPTKRRAVRRELSGMDQQPGLFDT